MKTVLKFAALIRILDRQMSLIAIISCKSEINGRPDNSERCYQDKGTLRRTGEVFRFTMPEFMLQGHAPAQYQLAQMLPQDDRQTRQWYERAATQGFPPAQHQLAAWLEARRDYAQAARWYAQAAAHDIPAAQYALGRLYLKGHGVPADENQAIHWLELAAIQGETAAQFDLGMLHMQRGNRDRALSWLQQASATGHEEARKALKIMGM